MEQLSLARDEFSGRGGHSAKLYVFPVVNGSSLSMYPWKYVNDAEDNQTSLQTLEKGYEQFVADVWVGIVLTLMVLSCLCCICSCLLYHRLLEWKRKVFGPPPADTSARRQSSGSHASGRSEVESLPSYTVVSGLPSYEEALEQLKMSSCDKARLAAAEEVFRDSLLPPPPPPSSALALDVGDLPPPFSDLEKVATTDAAGDRMANAGR